MFEAVASPYLVSDDGKFLHQKRNDRTAQGFSGQKEMQAAHREAHRRDFRFTAHADTRMTAMPSC